MKGKTLPFCYPTQRRCTKPPFVLPIDHDTSHSFPSDFAAYIPIVVVVSALVTRLPCDDAHRHRAFTVKARLAMRLS
ncbi:hypothetical protein CC80DRAFT_327213 [Byssothecium circinans]|uniref:Uncharacterized protein n=1 Tax=Byssothecium circinans TaxID=147558 RepID=A0A6A5U545_9PLEO|nr:hypothetical protein CC80DRAFT_327213 [Byssothecium circinans]